MLLSVLLVACGGDINAGESPTDDGRPDHGPADDSPASTDTAGADNDAYVADEDPVQPALRLDDVADAIADALDATRAVDVGALFDAYDDAMAGRSSACPYTDADYDIYNVDYWYDNCTADSGSHFSGYGYGYHYTEWWSDQYYYRHNGYWFGDAKIDLPDGSAFTASGSASISDYDDTTYGGTGYYAYVTGEFTSTSPRWSSSWLADDLSASLSLSRYGYGADPGETSLSGGISHLGGTVNAVQFDHVHMLSASFGSECAIEPGGTISVRDATGDWYDVTFQGPSAGSTSTFPAECDGCGEVWFRGEPLGDICPDLTTLIQWGA